MSRPLLVGQAPGPNTDPLEPLYPAPASSAGGRLAFFMGLTPEQYLEIYDRVNLLNEFPGGDPKRDKFPLHDGKIAAASLRPLLRERVVVLLGRNVALSWKGEVARAGPMEWSVCPRFGTRLSWVPHPSGRNRWYNSDINRTKALSFWQGLLVTLGRSAEASQKLENAA